MAHTTAFVTPVVEHWLEREIAQWVHPMKDRSDDPWHHERTLLPRSYISLLLANNYGPNNDSPNPYEHIILEIIEEFETQQFLLCGDFSFVLIHSLDKNQPLAYQ